MHEAALQYVTEQVAEHNLNQAGFRVLELGGRDVNGTIRHLFNRAEFYVSVDIRRGHGVDVVADAADVNIDGGFNVVVSTELLEHTSRAAEIVSNAAKHLNPGGMLLVTTAGPGRAPHGSSGESKVPYGEHYGNIEPATLGDWLFDAGFAEFDVDQLDEDVRCWARL